MQQSNESATEKKIETAERDQRGRIVEHATRRVFEEAALLEKTIFHQISQAMATRELLQYFFQWISPLQRSWVCLWKNGFQNSCDILQAYFPAAEFLAGAKRKILHE